MKLKYCMNDSSTAVSGTEKHIFLKHNLWTTFLDFFKDYWSKTSFLQFAIAYLKLFSGFSIPIGMLWIQSFIIIEF